MSGLGSSHTFARSVFLLKSTSQSQTRIPQMRTERQKRSELNLNELKAVRSGFHFISLQLSLFYLCRSVRILT